MNFPPFPEPDRLLSDSQEVADITGMESLLPGMGAMIAAMAYVMQDVIEGEYKTCTCGVCTRLREIGETVITTVARLWS